MAGLLGHISQRDKEYFEDHGDWNPKEEEDLCPDCGAPLKSGNSWSGVKCSKCEYWFCY